MDNEDFDALKTLMEEEFGLSLKAHTRESFTKKIQPRLEALRMSSMKEYLDYLANDPLSKIELHDLPSFVMNTESYFLREYAQFELFLDLYRQKRKNKVLQSDRSISILSAGCSAGQEPYSIAMLLRNQPEPLHGWDIRILGLDINLLALEKARSGVYSAYSLRSPNTDLIEKYFKKTYSETCETPKECFRLKPEIISSIDYVHGNILHPLVLKGISNLDFIFCRNLLMYMSRKATDRIALSLWEALADDGYLFIGQSETLRKRDDLFEPVCFPGATLYKKTDRPQLAERQEQPAAEFYKKISTDIMATDQSTSIGRWFSAVESNRRSALASHSSSASQRIIVTGIFGKGESSIATSPNSTALPPCKSPRSLNALLS